MTKAELVAAVADKCGFSKREADTLIKATMDTIAEALANGDSVRLVGFGTFEVREHAARNGINPQTMETIKIPAKRVPAFKAGIVLKKAVSEPKSKSSKKKKK